MTGDSAPDMRIGAVVQARTGSSRLPGKVLREVEGRPLLGYLLDRLERARTLQAVVVATSVDPSDDPIAAFCAQRGVACHRGPLDDVAARFRHVLEREEFDAFVRVSGDSPLLDWRLVDRLVGIFRVQEADLVTNVARRTFPRGQSIEVVRTAAFLAAEAEMTDPSDREHVTQYLYRESDGLRIVPVEAPHPYPPVHLAVDTPADFDAFARVVAQMRRPHWEYGLDEVVALAGGGA